MANDSDRCRVLCELIDREPEDSPRAEIYVRLLWHLLDRQRFCIPATLHWGPSGFQTMVATA